MRGKNSVLRTICLVFLVGMVVLSCANGTTDPTSDGYDITVTITGIPEEYIGVECEIEVSLSAGGWGIDIYQEEVTETTMTVHYNLTEEDKQNLKNYGIPYNPNGSYWIEFQIYADFLFLITPTAIKFSSAKATVDFSVFVEDSW
jgi:hypothetical protein